MRFNNASAKFFVLLYALAFCLLFTVSSLYAANPLVQPIALPTIPQDAGAYLKPATADQLLMSHEEQDRRAAHSLLLFWSPWSGHQGSGIHDQLSLVTHYRANGYYGYNFHRLSSSLIAQWQDEIRGAKAVGGRAAIIVQHTALRALPTALPVYGDYHAAGEGYPFDLLQISAEWLGKPISVLYLSRAGDWAFIDDGDAMGWVSVRDMAYVNLSDQVKLKQSHMIAVIKDFVPVKNNAGEFLFDSRIGMFLASTNQRAFIPIRRSDGYAEFQSIYLPSDLVVDYPWVATPRHFSLLMNQMMGQPYGWGGLYNYRDCSLTMKNLFAPFGIDLPRNSQAQADSGHKWSLAGLSDMEKENFIASHAKPYMSLLHMHGHIVLYIGQYHGDGIIFQNKWGLATDDATGDQGRAVLGQAHIAPLTFGRNVPNAATTFIKSVDSLTNLN
jgi:hypothetical protein